VERCIECLEVSHDFNWLGIEADHAKESDPKPKSKGEGPAHFADLLRGFNPGP
jgi:hypothetical protein